MLYSDQTKSHKKVVDQTVDWFKKGKTMKEKNLKALK